MHLVRNRRKDFKMEKMSRAVEIPANLYPVLKAAPKTLLHPLYGSEGPAWGTSFADMEELVVQLSHHIGSELLQQALQRQASQPVPPHLQHCPTCGRPTDPRENEPRS